MRIRALVLGTALGFLAAIAPSCGTTPCGPQSCDGCCDASGNCVRLTLSNSDIACGQKGATCTNCSLNNQTCNSTSFTCVGGATGGGTGATGGGTGATGGGTAATGGGTAATGGGTAATGGGTGATGGGTGATGGGTGATGGGTGATGGGTGSCSLAAQNCPSGQACLYSDVNGHTECFPGLCDLVAQDCPTDSKCTYGRFPDGGVIRACLVAGARLAGETCGPTQDDCAKGLFCVTGRCQPFCYQNATCTGGAVCTGLTPLNGTREVPITCQSFTACDPLIQNCPTGQGCYAISGVPACLTAGTGMLGAVCGGAAGRCAPGLLCLAGASGNTCNLYCNVDGGSPACSNGMCALLAAPDGGALPYGGCR